MTRSDKWGSGDSIDAESKAKLSKQNTKLRIIVLTIYQELEQFHLILMKYTHVILEKLVALSFRYSEVLLMDKRVIYKISIVFH